ncbi:MAG: 16S rRNA (guanine(527)-N(7))-methyltransferase RsmG [Flavobacteriales bacterium]|nr:16S rRNA (guanine(527)-N(7))-methyltransferase RsmG [Flavobacteriales bacterium]
MEQIQSYFPNLSSNQIRQFKQLPSLYEHWNTQINVVSRKDVGALLERHVLHSLGIAKVMSFESGSNVLDVGTGGGFPGIPLAILFPEVNFLLVDSIGKKIKVVQAIVDSLELQNVRAEHKRAEKIEEKFDFVVSRAVTRMPDFLKWIRNSFKKECTNEFPNGLLYLKGGDLTDEMTSVDNYYNEFLLSDYFQEDFFATKKVVYVQMV